MKKKQRTSKTRAPSAAELDAMHDAGVDLSSHMDLAKAVRPGRAVQRVNVDFPVDLLREIDIRRPGGSASPDRRSSRFGWQTPSLRRHPERSTHDAISFVSNPREVL
jgi:hypothetical protein